MPRPGHLMMAFISTPDCRRLSLSKRGYKSVLIDGLEKAIKQPTCSRVGLSTIVAIATQEERMQKTYEAPTVLSSGAVVAVTTSGATSSKEQTPFEQPR